MPNRPPAQPDREVLSEPAVARLLARASELDAAGRAGSAVDDLRAAAAEAGISAGAFDAALAELRGSENATVPDRPAESRRRSHVWAIAVAVAALMVAGAAWMVVRKAPAGDDGVPRNSIVEEAILLRCLSPGEAAGLIRPVLPLRGNTIMLSPANAPRVITIRAPAAQLNDVKSLLERYEGAGSSACTARPIPLAKP